MVTFRFDCRRQSREDNQVSQLSKDRKKSHPMDMVKCVTFGSMDPDSVSSLQTGRVCVQPAPLTVLDSIRLGQILVKGQAT